MNKIAIVTGTPGAGKSSVIEGVAPNSHKVISIGTEMMKIAQNEKEVEDRDLIRKLRSEQITTLRLKACKSIGQMEGNIIIDTHASVKNGPRYVPGFSEKELDYFPNLKAFIYIDSDPREIILRRSSDKHRKRDIESVGEIKQQREINLNLISAFAAYKNVPIYIIKNEQGKMEDAIEGIQKVFREVFGQ